MFMEYEGIILLSFDLTISCGFDFVLNICLFQCSLEFCMVNLAAFEYDMYVFNFPNGPSLMPVVVKAPLMDW